LIKCLAAGAAVAVCLGAPARGRAVADARYEWREVHMGMEVRLVSWAPDAARAAAAARAAFGRVAALDARLSDFRPDSDVARLAARAPAWVPVSRDVATALERAVAMARGTGGAFDPTLGALTSLWREARVSGTAPPEEAVARARARTGWRALEVDVAARRARLTRPGVAVDLGGIAKGFILQEALAELDRHGLGRALFEAGGDIVCGDAPPGAAGWRVEVAGAGAAFAARASALARAALATSGAAAQFLDAGGRRYSHVLDPASGLGTTRGRLVYVIDRDAATADALATALGVVPDADVDALLSNYPEARAAIVKADSLRTSPRQAP
jgi:thiamine biosynthesis lipoprotein